MARIFSRPAWIVRVFTEISRPPSGSPLAAAPLSFWRGRFRLQLGRGAELMGFQDRREDAGVVGPGYEAFVGRHLEKHQHLLVLRMLSDEYLVLPQRITACCLMAEIAC